MTIIYIHIQFAALFLPFHVTVQSPLTYSLTKINFVNFLNSCNFKTVWLFSMAFSWKIQKTTLFTDNVKVWQKTLGTWRKVDSTNVNAFLKALKPPCIFFPNDLQLLMINEALIYMLVIWIHSKLDLDQIKNHQRNVN